MEAWGGSDDWEFEFEPEILRQQPVKVAGNIMIVVVIMEIIMKMIRLVIMEMMVSRRY